MPWVEPPVRKRQFRLPNAVAPEGLGLLNGSAGLEQIPGGGELGEVQSGGGGELRKGEPLPLVTGHVHPEGMLRGEAAKGVTEWRVLHERPPVWKSVRAESVTGRL